MPEEHKTIEERAKELYPEPEPLESGKYESREEFRTADWLVLMQRNAYKAGSKEGVEEFKDLLKEVKSTIEWTMNNCKPDSDWETFFNSQANTLQSIENALYKLEP